MRSYLYEYKIRSTLRLVNEDVIATSACTHTDKMHYIYTGSDYVECSYFGEYDAWATVGKVNSPSKNMIDNMKVFTNLGIVSVKNNQGDPVPAMLAGNVYYEKDGTIIKCEGDHKIAGQ